MTALVAVVLGSTTGCLTRSVADRGTGWWRITSERATLHTDLDVDDALVTARTLDRIQRTLAAEIPGCLATEGREPVDVVVFGHAGDYDDVDPRHASATTLPAHPGLAPIPTMVVVRSAHDMTSVAAIHALAHRAFAACHPRAPAWAHEGIAMFFETMREDDGGLHLGAAPADVIRGAPPSATVSWLVRQSSETFFDPDRPALEYGIHGAHLAFDPRGRSASAQRFEGAWALVHFALVGPDFVRDAFARYLEDPSVVDGRPDPRLPVDLYVVPDFMGHPLRERSRAPVPDAPIETMPSACAPAEADVLWATLLAARADDRARAEIREHLAFATNDPSTHTHAELLRADLRLLERSETRGTVVAALVASADPSDRQVLHARAWLEVQRSHVANAARLVLGELGATSDLDTRDRAAAALLAARLRMIPRAEHEAELALAAAPGDWTTATMLEHVLAAAGRWQSAHAARTVARVLLGHTLPGVLDEAFFYGVRGRDRAEFDAGETGPTPGDPNERGTLVTLSAGDADPLLRLERVAAAEMPASALDPRCVGRVGATPVATIELPLGVDGPLVVRTVGDADTVIAVVDADGEVRCDDDSGGLRSAAVLVEWERGPLRVYAGAFRADEAGAPYALEVARAAGTIGPELAGARCGDALVPGAVRVGMRVVLGRHASWVTDGAIPDPIRETNWVTPMDAYVGRDARVIGLGGNDEAGCPGVRVDLDAGDWFWRVRDLAPTR